MFYIIKQIFNRLYKSLFIVKNTILQSIFQTIINKLKSVNLFVNYDVVGGIHVSLFSSRAKMLLSFNQYKIFDSYKIFGRRFSRYFIFEVCRSVIVRILLSKCPKT